MAEAAGVVAKPASLEDAHEETRVDSLDRFAKTVALLVFALGVGLLVAVFFWTRDLFDSLAQANQQWLKRNVDPGVESGVAEYVPALGAQLLRVGLLFVLGYVSSSIATKGAQLFSAAGGAHAGKRGASGNLAELP